MRVSLVFAAMALFLSLDGLSRGAFPMPAANAAAASDEPKESFIVTEENGQRRSRGRRVRYESRFSDRPCVVVETTQIRTILREKTKYEETIRRKVVTAPDGAAMSATETTQSGSERRTESVRVANGEARFESVGPAGSQRKSLHVPSGTLFGIEPDWLIARGVRPGKTYEARVLDRVGVRLVLERATVEEPTEEEFLGQTVKAWTARVEREGDPVIRMVFTEQGELIRIEADTLVVKVVTKEEYETDRPLAKIATEVPIDFRLPACDTYARLVFELTPADSWRKYVHDSDYVRVQDEGERLIATLKRSTPLLPSRPQDRPFPFDVPDEMKPYLADGPNILPSKLAIRQCAAARVRGEKDVLQAVALLAGWVNQRIAYRSGDSLNPSPLTTLEDRSGDCSEHADLFASLARSVGIPTRHCLGLIVQSENAVYHTWAEAWLFGKWVPIDTTVNRVGLPAGYLLTACAGPDNMLKDEFAWQMRKGGLKMNLLSAVRDFPGRGSYTLIPNEKRTYVIADPNDPFFANLYWGFSLVRPADWTGAVKLDSVELQSPDQKAKMKVEAMGIVFRATQSDLERITDNLVKNLKDFRQKEARIVSFGRRRPVDSMMIDFTCSQDGTPLHCRQYIVPRPGRSYRISLWTPGAVFSDYVTTFESILDTMEF